MTDIYLDIETTRLSPSRRRCVVWEIGLIVGDDEYLWQIRPDLSVGDGNALRIGKYRQRIRPELRYAKVGTVLRIFHPTEACIDGVEESDTYRAYDSPGDVADEIATLTDDAVIWGSNVGAFDYQHLDAWMRLNGQCPSWYYHPGDITSRVQGWCAAKGIRMEGRKSDTWAAAVGVNPEDHDRHTALGDCRWVKAQLEATSIDPNAVNLGATRRLRPTPVSVQLAKEATR